MDSKLRIRQIGQLLYHQGLWLQTTDSPKASLGRKAYKKALGSPQNLWEDTSWCPPVRISVRPLGFPVNITVMMPNIHPCSASQQTFPDTADTIAPTTPRSLNRPQPCCLCRSSYISACWVVPHGGYPTNEPSHTSACTPPPKFTIWGLFKWFTQNHSENESLDMNPSPFWDVNSVPSASG